MAERKVKNKKELDDLALWRQVTRSVTPFPRPQRREQPVDEHKSLPKQTRPSRAPKPSTVPLIARPSLPRAPQRLGPERLDPARLDPARLDPARLDPDRPANLDRRQAERLRRGKMSIEATLDLHGLRQEEAETVLADFLARSQAQGLRCVIVITGKGNFSKGNGVLRAALPDWLNRHPNRSRLLSFSQAQPQHGGAGAFYLLLKRPSDGRPDKRKPEKRKKGAP